MDIGGEREGETNKSTKGFRDQETIGRTFEHAVKQKIKCI